MTDKTTDELENHIRERLLNEGHLINPNVSVRLLNARVTVLGEVNAPGTFAIVNPKLNILYALSLAGDITQFGNRRNIKIIRNDNEINRVFYVNLTDQEVLNNADFMLQPHDIIYVAPLRKKFYAFNNITNLVSMALSAVTLYLLINRY